MQTGEAGPHDQDIHLLHDRDGSGAQTLPRPRAQHLHALSPDRVRPGRGHGLTLGWGAPGRLVLGAAFAVVGCLIPPVVRRAAEHRMPAESYSVSSS
ncbi:hypothetical protein Aau02nite_26810 [Amorphoplanes auranticolor]|uniref:Uncharacterized protein n=1 Tax=Actinoplanes auranticolor TaxID=47988 RepID=A0A919VL06_9ACTN|nr:hypothetical protein Aau02nite_26810 [Actinoplanes auranticolor]